jgi:hypothetical protein
MYEILLAESSTEAGNAGAGFMYMLMFMYMVPFGIALVRRVRNVGSVFVVNLFFGWTLIGWVAALAMAMRTVDRVRS